MNGEMAQMSNIVISARFALRDKGKMDCPLDKYVSSIKFVFIPRGIFLKKTKTVDSVTDWFEICRKQGLEDIKYLVPTSISDRSILGFSNTSQNSIHKRLPLKGIDQQDKTCSYTNDHKYFSLFWFYNYCCQKPYTGQYDSRN